MLRYSFVILVMWMTSNFSENLPQSISDQLLGQWIWTKTTYSDRGGKLETTTPTSCNCTKSILIKDNGIVEVYENGSFLRQAEYQIDSIVMVGDPTTYRFRSSVYSGTVEFQADGSMGIGAFGICGAIDYFKRGKPNR